MLQRRATRKCSRISRFRTAAMVTVATVNVTMQRYQEPNIIDNRSSLSDGPYVRRVLVHLLLSQVKGSQSETGFVERERKVNGEPLKGFKREDSSWKSSSLWTSVTRYEYLTGPTRREQVEDGNNQFRPRLHCYSILINRITALSTQIRARGVTLFSYIHANLVAWVISRKFPRWWP